MSLTSDGNMTAGTWEHLAEMEPIANLFRGLPFNDPWRIHGKRFVADRIKRIGRVSKMTIDNQNKHYRKLGYF